MSLQVWLPLTKDLRQQGLSNVTVTNNGATFNSAGKLGGCYSFSNNTMILPSFDTTRSISLWLKTTLTNSTIAFVDYKSKLGFGFQSNGYIIANCGNTSFKMFSNINFQSGQWNHIVVTRDDALTDVALYINGILQTERINTNNNWTNNVDGCYIGGRSTGTNMTCFINDFRVYDHCLSPMEVKQISQGLVLHYPLNRNGWGQENLLPQNTTQFINWTNINSDCVSVTTNGYQNVFNLIQGLNGKWENLYSSAITVESGIEYTLSCKYKVNSNYNYTSSYGEFGLTVMKAAPTNSNPKSNTIARIAFDNVAGDYKYAYITFTPTVTTIYLNMCGGSIVDGQTNKEFNVDYIKLEKGSIATPWCPNSADTLATTMGLNSTIEYDCSGFCNNGIRNKTFTWTSDTPKYAVSQNFNNNHLIEAEGLPTETSTIACWIKWHTLPSGYTIPIHDKQSGLAIGLTNKTRLISYVGTGNGGSGSCVNVSLETNIWYHIVVVKTGTNTRKVYINGEEIISIANNNYWGGDLDKFLVGGRHISGSYSNYIDGQICDVRAYATALSADDVKSLYQNSAYIDSSGNIYGTIHEV